MNILTEIFERKRELLAGKISAVPLDEMKRRAADAEPTRGFLTRLQNSRTKPALIAEVKKGSPSAGTIRADFEPVAIAQAYERAGATCLSVLTDVEYFQGSDENLQLCRATTQLPVLRKDFTVDAYDLYEARAIGADAVLLIVNGLEQSLIRDLLELARELTLDALVEAHTQAEAETALACGADLIGINNRNLETFATEIEVSEAILPRLVGHATLVSESALETRADIERVQAAGADAVLIGTAFCREPDIEAAVKRVMPW